MQSGLHDTGQETAAPRVGPLFWCAAWWIGGTIAGHTMPQLEWWLILSACIAIALIPLLYFRRDQAVRAWALLGLFALAAAWTVAWEHHPSQDNIRHVLADRSRLVRVSGTVEGAPTITSADAGAFADFSYRGSVTFFTLRLHSLHEGDTSRRVSGRLRVKLEQIDHRLRGGDHIEATGWLTGFAGPNNPGERDYRRIMHQRGIDGHLTLRHRGNWRHLHNERRLDWFAARQMMADAAHASLRLNMQPDAMRGAFLDGILLGRASRDLAPTYDAFRTVGLAHLLAISGAHLGILLGMVWVVARLVTPHPARCAMVVLAALVMFLLGVPWRTPIVRAAIMAGLFTLAYASGRRLRAMDVLALAAMIVLIWRPGDLLTPGFQLSFCAVAGLLLFTRPVSHRIYPAPLIDPHRVRYLMARRIADAAAVSIVAFCIVMPLVAHHFQLITPWAMVLSFLALPVVMVLLGLGYLKMMVGLIWPTLGGMLAYPLEWTADVSLAATHTLASLKTMAIELPRAPSSAWTIGTILLACGILGGCFAGRYKSLTTAMVLCTAWLIVETQPGFTQRFNPWAAPPPKIMLNMLAVGDGSCFIVRSYGSDERGRVREHVLMYDCGSLAYLDVGLTSVVPALRELGINRIDTLVLSHADFDHFSGVLDLADGVPVSRVLVPAHMPLDAERRPRSVTAYLLAQLAQRDIPTRIIRQGWQETYGDVTFDVIWPHDDFEAPSSNAASLVLSVRGAGRRILLCGDIEQQAMTTMLANNMDLRADVCDIPHHGSFVAAAPAFLTAVSPQIVLQSSGRLQFLRDRWEPFFAATSVPRLITAELGMVEVRIEKDGTLIWRAFRQPR